MWKGRGWRQVRTAADASYSFAIDIVRYLHSYS